MATPVRFSRITFCLVAGIIANTALAQDSAFLACSQYSDRDERLICLETALNTAMSNAGRTPNFENTQLSPKLALEDKPQADVSANIEQTSKTALASTEDSPSLLARLRDFGTKEAPSIALDEHGNDELHDTIVSLSKRNNMWLITLASGQLWKQLIPDRLNLKESDEIRIYRAGLGNSFRLEAKRLSGFIRVERIK